MERKDQRDPYRERRSESRREMGAQNQDYGGQDRSERQQFGRDGANQGRQFEWDRDQWDVESGRAMSEGGRQYEQPAGGTGYGRPSYAAGQSGQGYYASRPATERSGAGYGSYASLGADYGYGSEAYTGRETGRRYSGLGPRNYFRSDERIRDDVCHRLTQDPDVDASNVEVTVVGREVTLSGTVPTREQRRQAEDIAEQVGGVSHVQNNVRVSRQDDWRSSRDTRFDVPRDETDSLISSDKVQGTAVYGADRQKIGSVETLMLTKRGGRVAYAVLSFGGFLGLGTEHYPLPWNALKYDTSLSGYVVNLTKDQLQNAPKYGQNDSWDWNDPATTRKIDQYYGPWTGVMY